MGDFVPLEGQLLETGSNLAVPNMQMTDSKLRSSTEGHVAVLVEDVPDDANDFPLVSYRREILLLVIVLEIGHQVFGCAQQSASSRCILVDISIVLPLLPAVVLLP